MKTYVLEITFTDGTKGEDIFTPERIKKAFNFHNGTDSDLLRYVDNNKTTIKILSSY